MSTSMMDFSADHLTKMSFIRPIAGKENEVLEAVQKYTAEVETNEPETLSFFLIDILDPAPDGGKEFCILSRYKSQAAFDTHNHEPYYELIKKGMMENLREPPYTRAAAPISGFMVRH